MPRIGEEIPIGGPANVSFVEIALHLLAIHGRPDAPKHAPLPALRAMAVLARPINPDFARKARAAVVMNTTDMTFDASRSRSRFPEIPASTLAEVTVSTNFAHPR